MPGVSFRSWSSAGVRWFSALALLAAPAGPAFAAPSTISVRNYGAYPDWSPYKGTVIEKAITFGQNNHFADNSYFGSWGVHRL